MGGPEELDSVGEDSTACSGEVKGISRHSLLSDSPTDFCFPYLVSILCPF